MKPFLFLFAMIIGYCSYGQISNMDLIKKKYSDNIEPSGKIIKNIKVKSYTRIKIYNSETIPNPENLMEKCQNVYDSAGKYIQGITFDSKDTSQIMANVDYIYKGNRKITYY